jgi:AcrR family transcriptional regulator
MARLITSAGGSRRTVAPARGLRRASAVSVPAAGDASERVSKLQRARLLAGAVAAIDERGYTRTTVAHITARARVSRRTFYELFSNRDECLAALIDDVVALVEADLRAVDPDGQSWRERIRAGLGAILAFCDREPALARVCVVHALSAGPLSLARREAALARLAAVVDAGRGERSQPPGNSQMIAEGLVGAICAIVHGRLARRESEPLIGLQSQLTGLLVLPYLGAAAARREQRLPARPPAAAAARRPAMHGDPLAGLPMRLTYRTTRVLECIAACPGVSNRLVAEHAGVADQGQISKLLGRLQRIGLVENASRGHTKGEPNAWRLTQLGEQVTQRLAAGPRRNTSAAA